MTVFSAFFDTTCAKDYEQLKLNHNNLHAVAEPRRAPCIGQHAIRQSLRGTALEVADFRRPRGRGRSSEAEGRMRGGGGEGLMEQAQCHLPEEGLRCLDWKWPCGRPRPPRSTAV